MQAHVVCIFIPSLPRTTSKINFDHGAQFIADGLLIDAQ